MKNLIIRPEKPSDHSAVKTILQTAFKKVVHSDQSEHLLVERLRASPAYLPKLALVVEIDNQVIGYILLTKILIVGAGEQFPALALAPVAVAPAYQHQGIGAALIRAAHERAGHLGHSAIILVGHADYYPRFGYRQCREFGIELPFHAPAENCMVIELQAGALENMQGMVEYPPAFFE